MEQQRRLLPTHQSPAQQAQPAPPRLHLLTQPLEAQAALGRVRSRLNHLPHFLAIQLSEEAPMVLQLLLRQLQQLLRQRQSGTEPSRPPVFMVNMDHTEHNPRRLALATHHLVSLLYHRHMANFQRMEVVQRYHKQ